MPETDKHLKTANDRASPIWRAIVISSVVSTAVSIFVSWVMS